MNRTGKVPQMRAAVRKGLENGLFLHGQRCPTKKTSGCTLLAQHFGVSRQRIFQILKEERTRAV